jgi:hypothetical protein
MLLYCLVGAEIVKRRHELRSITSDSIPLEENIPPSYSRRIYHHDNNAPVNYSRRFNHNVAMTVQVDVDSRPKTSANSNDGNESSFASRCSVSTPHPPSERRPIERPALSIRQYIVMPAMFFVVLLAIWVAPTTNRIAAFVRPGFESFPLLIAVGAMGSLRGFWNGVVFITIGVKGRKSRNRV